MFKLTVINGKEATQAQELAKDVESKLVSVYVNAFTEASAKLFYDDFNRALATKQEVVPVIIDSYGGSVDALVSMMDIIKASPVEVATVCLAKAMSCGALLLSCGSEGMRFSAPSARIMIHHVAGFTFGKMADLEVDVQETKRLQNLVFNQMDRNTGKKEGYFLQQLKERGNTDWFLTPEEAKSHNIVNHLRIPHLRTDVTIKSILV